MPKSKDKQPQSDNLEYVDMRDKCAVFNDECMDGELCCDGCFVPKEEPDPTEKPEVRPLEEKPDGYLAKYIKAKAARKVTLVTHQIHTWSNDGDVLVGILMGTTPFNDGKFDTEVNAYLIKTDDGLRSCVLGSYTDSQLKNRSLQGQLIAIHFCGQKQLEGGRKVNIFDIEVIEDIDS